MSGDAKPAVDFIPNRVFINQLDSYHGKQIALILSDKLFRAKADEGEEAIEEEEVEKATDFGSKEMLKYEIVGTVRNPHYRKTEDITLIIDETDNEKYMKEIMKCAFIVFDITNDDNEIAKAHSTLQAIEKILEEQKDDAPKQFAKDPVKRVFLLISTVMTWAKTKPVDPEDPEVPFVETDFKKRKSHPNYRQHIDFEKEVVKIGKMYKDKLRCIVLAVGITYGGEENDLHFLFKLAWNNEKELPIISPGKNTIPLLHIKDLVSILFALFENVPKKKYIVAVEQTPSKQKQLVKALAKVLGSGRTKMISKEEAFLYPEIYQKVYDRITVNLKMEPNFIVNDMEIPWQSESSMVENIVKMMKEYKESRKLISLRILLHGPPAVGKTRIAKELCKFYDIHYISVPSVIKDTLDELRFGIQYARAQIKAKEEKDANPPEETEEEEEEEEEEDLEGKIEELQSKLKEIEKGLEEGENGKLPDAFIIEMIQIKLNSNPCQNQGFLLDGYPKTAEQTKAIFSIGEEGGEEEAEEEGEEEEGGEAKKIILPEFVFTLDASDEFLCGRMMNLPESEVQGTHYTEEHMVRRLAEFRANNTDDNTLLNLFDEIEIHPIMVDADTDDQEGIISLLKMKIGEPRGYPPTEHELEERRLAAEAFKAQQEREEQEAREEMERIAEAERRKKMEQWIDMLQALQKEEQQMLTAQAKPLREYLIKFVFPTLTRGLLEAARIKPEDPVDFLAEYLFRENPEGRMFDPAFVAKTDTLLRTIADYQEQLDGEGF